LRLILKKTHILLTGQVPNIRITKIFATFYSTKKISMLKRNGTSLPLAMAKDPVVGGTVKRMARRENL
jgi:signal transduction histidine kinase